MARATTTIPAPMKSSPRERQRPGALRTERANGARHGSRGAARRLARPRKGAQEGHRQPTSSRGEFHWWSSPSQKELSCGIHPAESYPLCAHQNGWGNPERAPRKTRSLLGLRLCQSPSLVADGSGENGCVRCDQMDDLLSLGAELPEEGGMVKEHQGV